MKWIDITFSAPLSLLLLCLAAGHVYGAGLKKDAVLQSLEENRVEWKARTAGPRPHLYFNGMNLAEVREKLRADKEGCAILLKTAETLAAKPLPPFLTPEEEMKEKGTPKLVAYAQNWQRQIGNNLVTLCIAGLVDDSPALRETIRQQVLDICRYPTWGFLSNVPNCDLSCAHLAVGVALAWDWYNDLWTPEERELILHTIRDRANGLLGGGYGSAYWYNTFDHNHNHVSAAGLGICGAAFFNDVPEAPEWLAFARLNFQKVARLAASDGSSPEGVSYWSYGFFFILQYIEATRGIIDSADLYQSPFLKNAATYRLHVSTPGFQGILPWGDAVGLDFSGPRQNLYRLADQYQDDAGWWLSGKIPSKLHAFNLLWGTNRPEPKHSGPQTLDHCFRDGEIVTSRTGWGDGDYLLSLKSGFANRPHSHLDVGSLAFSFGNEWLLTAPGYGINATAPGFWDRKARRWKFFSPATESHSTLLVDGENQRFDMESKGTINAFFSTPFWTWTETDLTRAYQKVSAMSRGILHRRGDYILVFDSVEAPEAVTVEWLAQLGRKPSRDGNALEVVGEKGSLRLEMLRPGKPFEPRAPTVPNIDIRKQEIHTHAVQERGQTVSMLALLTPRFPGAPAAGMKTAVNPLEGGGEEIVIEGSGWTDRIVRGAPVEIVDGSGLGLKARFAAIRTRGSEVESFIAHGVEAMKLAEMEFAVETPCDLGMQQTPEGIWILDSSRKLEGVITLPSGRSLVALDSRSGNSMGEGEGGFRYAIAGAEADLSQATRWLASLIGMRNEPELEIRAPAPQPALPASERLVIEAEDFAYQTKGKATVKQQPRASGESVIKGVSGGNHLGWRFEVQTPGEYQLRLRHEDPTPEDPNPGLLQATTVTVVLDGVIPGEAMREVTLPETEQGKRWQESVLSDKDGKPLIFQLSAGEHDLRLRFSRGINLDVLTFTGATPK